MEKNDFYKKQYLSSVEMDVFQDQIDDGIKDFLLAHSYQGIVAGLVATASPGAPTFNLVITAGTAYDKNGEHVYVASDQTIDVSIDELGATTYTDLGGGEDRWVSIFLHFDRAPSDPRIDGDKQTVYYVQAESYTIRVVNGTKGAAPVTEPALHADDILIADLYMYNGMADVVAGDINVHRREEVGYYRNSTGGIVKHKNDTMLGPDKDCIEETLDSDIAISGYRKYGDRFVEYRDRQHVRITSRLAEFNDDFFTSALMDWWTITPVGPITVSTLTNLAWGVYSVQIDNGGGGSWLADGQTVVVALEDQPVFEVALYLHQNAGPEYACFWGIQIGAALVNTHTEEGWGFYVDNGNIIAINHSGGAATATDTGVVINTTRFQHYRAHLVCDTAGIVVKILFFIDDALVATHTTNLPSTLGAAFAPFINFATTAPPQTSNKLMYIDRFFIGGIRKYLHE